MSDQKYELINVQKIKRPNPPVRIHFEEEEISALTESIREEGILIPLLVRRIPDGFEVIDGDCRLEAAYRLRLREIPCVVRDATDSETHVLRMLANLERSNPDPVSEALYIAKVISSGALTIQDFAAKLGRSEQWIKDRLTIAEMPEYMQDALRQKKIPLGVALILFEVDDDKTRHSWFNSAIIDGMSIRGAQGALQEYRRLQFIQESNPGDPNIPVIPMKPPIVLIACVRCGEHAPITDLHSVLVHREGCPSTEFPHSEG